MPAAQGFINELQFERISTRKMLERCPADQFAWKPHEKSMTLGQLAAHVAEIPGYLSMVSTSDEVDFAKTSFAISQVNSSQELVALFDRKIEQALTDISAVSDEVMNKDWTLRNGEHVIFTVPKRAAMRSFAINHFIHHRGQLSVYLRLLNIPLPSIYGPSADETI